MQIRIEKVGGTVSGLKKFVIVLAVLVIIFPAVAFGYVYSRLKTMQSGDNFDSLLSKDYKSDSEITNILLMGTDERPGEEVSRSDSMMILTVDTKHKSLKLTSLGRDTYVNIKGHGKQKLTHAYAYGKADLLIDTVESNFNLDIQHFAQVNFYSFMDIVDALGGVDVKIEEGEIHELNKFINETYNWDKKAHKEKIKYIDKPGTHHLNGYQALSFSRIRKNDGTMERDSRQRQVIQSMVNKLSTLSVTRYNKLMESILPYVKTNMSPTEILGTAKDILSIGNMTLKSMQFPLHPENEVNLEGKGYVIPFDPYEVDILHDFIFENIMPTKESIEEARQNYLRTGETKYNHPNQGEDDIDKNKLNKNTMNDMNSDDNINRNSSNSDVQRENINRLKNQKRPRPAPRPSNSNDGYQQGADFPGSNSSDGTGQGSDDLGDIQDIE